MVSQVAKSAKLSFIVLAAEYRSEVFWVLFGQFGSACGGLFSIKLLTHLMVPAEIGKLSIANTIALLVSTNLFGPLGQGLMRFWSISKSRGEIHHYLRISRRIIVSLSIGIGFFSFLLLTWYYLWDRNSWWMLMAVAVIAGAFAGWLAVRNNMLVAARKRKAVALINTFYSFLKLGSALLLITLLSPKASTVIVGFSFASALILLGLEKYYSDLNGKNFQFTNSVLKKKDEQKRILTELIRFSWPFLIWGIFSWIHQSCDRWALQVYHGAGVVGAYSVISQLSLYPLLFGSNFVSMLFLPIAYDRAGRLDSSHALSGANRIIIKMICIYLIGVTIVIGFFLLCHRQIVLIISNENYAVYSQLLPGLTIAWALFYLGQMLSGFGLLAKEPKRYVLPIITSGLSAAVATFYLSSISGPVGVVWGLALAGGLYAIWFGVIAVRFSRLQI